MEENVHNHGKSWSWARFFGGEVHVDSVWWGVRGVRERTA